MKSKGPSHKRSWLRLETLLVLGLCIKLVLTLTFILVLPAGSRPALSDGVAYAQDKEEEEKPGEKAKAPAGKEPSAAMTRQYRTMLDTLEAREKELDRRERRLKERESALKALEKQITARMAEIEATRKKLDALVSKQEKLVKEQKILKDKRIEHLVSAYKGMRPEKAGALVNNLDDDVAVVILSAMPGRAAGQILAYVNPQKAARLTRAISKRTPEKDQVKRLKKPILE